MKRTFKSEILKRVAQGLCFGFHFCLMASMVILPVSTILVPTRVEGAARVDYNAMPPFLVTSVTPNVLFVLDNSNSMDEDVDGAAVGSNSEFSKSEIARQAVKLIVNEYQDTMRLGLMAYQQSAIRHRQLHNSFYYCNYDPESYDPMAAPTPKDPTSNTKRYENPDDPGNFIYYDTALPYYVDDNQGTSYCYSYDFSYVEPEPSTCTTTSRVGCHNYWCYDSKTGVLDTPLGVIADPLASPIADGVLRNTYGYQNFTGAARFGPTDSDVASGFHEFGLEMASVYVGDTWFSNSSPGPGMLHIAIDDSNTVHIDDLNDLLGTSQFATNADIPLRNAGLTPLAGTIESAGKYFAGNLSTAEVAESVSPETPVQEDSQKNFVILITDGLPSTDKNGSTGNTIDLLDELRNEVTNLRSTTVTGYSDDFDVKTFVIGFAIPEELGDQLDELAVAGGTADENGKALLADNAEELAEKLKTVFLFISTEASSGAAASVISSARSGEGAIYQSLFFPEKTDLAGNEVNWVGQIHSLLIDAYGNMREDTNQNQQVDVIDDFIIVSNSDGTVYRYFDADGNQLLDGLTPVDCRRNHSCNTCSADNTIDCLVDAAYDTSGLTATDDNKLNLDDVKFLWHTSDWLNEISDAEVEDQRTYASILPDRFIFTWVDTDNDGIVDGTDSEVIPFVSSEKPSAEDLLDPAKIYTYLHLYPSFDDMPTGTTDDVSDLSSIDFSNFLAEQSHRQVNYIRGSDCVNSNSSLTCNTMLLTVDEVNGGTTTVVGSNMRSRQFDYDEDGTIETWRLGDIIYSTPTLVGRPAEAYHLLYRDKSYAAFAARYQKRRNVIYAGANDGMVHAFNGGFFESDPEKRFLNSIEEPYVDTAGDGYTAGDVFEDWNGNSVHDTTTSYALGAELWAYVPYNLLPHLYWLTDPTYNEESHVYYVDQKPRVFDARIFFQPDEVTALDDDHPYGWGTVMVMGMRFGGGTIMADMDKQSTTCEDRTECWLDTTCQDGTICSTGDTCSDGSACLVERKCSDTAEPCLLNSDCTGAGATCDDDISCGDGSVCQVYTCADLGAAGTCQVQTCGDLGATGTCEARNQPDSGDRVMKSAFMIFDITNPEKEPKLLAEVVMPRMGFATSYPTVVVVTDGDEDKNYKSNTTIEAGENKWFLAFGSGPADSNGDPGEFDYSTGAYNNEILENASSSQAGLYYMIDLKELATNNELWTLTDDSTDSGGSAQGVLEAGLASYETFEPNSFVSDSISVDYNLDFNADVLYFGTISGSSSTSWEGQLRRIVIVDDDPTSWDGDNVLMDVGQPISAAPAVGLDDDGRHWVYFGTGRFFSVDDKGDTSLQTYYGIKEPLLSGSSDALQKSWAQVTAPQATRPNGPNVPGAPPLVGSLVNVTNYQVFTNGDVLMVDGVAASFSVQLNDWDALIAEQKLYSGWYIDFEADRSAGIVTLKGERNLGQATLLGGLLSFTTFTPDSDVYETGGTSDFWALYYKTGTAYYSGVLGAHDGFDSRFGRDDRAKRSLADQEDNANQLIQGMVTSPGVHTGREGGSAVFVQSSTGEIIKVEEKNPLRTKSGMQAWKLR